MPQLTIQQTFALAVQHHQAGRLSQAEQLYRQILARQPRSVDVLHLLGVLAAQAGRHDVAVELIGQAITLKPNFAEAHYNLAKALSEQGRLDDAIDAYRKAIAVKPNYADAQRNLGNALWKKGLIEEAITAYQQAIALRPTYAEAHNNLGVALWDKGQPNEAIAAYRRAVALKPDFADAHSNLGTALWENGQLEEAFAACRRAIALQPNLPEAHANLGNVLSRQGRMDEAIAAYRQAIAIKPSYAEAHSNLGIAFWIRGQPNEAIAACRRSIAIKPNYAEAHYNLASVLLASGEFLQGWEEYEWRWQRKDARSSRRPFAQEQWDGSPLQGRTILLHAEQGFGDTIQFIRYLPLVTERGGRAIIECQPELRRLLQPMAGGCPVVAHGAPLPDFDVRCPLLSLPRALGTMLASIPGNVPYLEADARDVETWRARLADQPPSIKVGLTWAGGPLHKDDRSRSIALATFAPLSRAPGVQFYSLQKGKPADQTKSQPGGMRPIDWTADLNDFADTAALIASLDLVISVDTVVVHLAGAMGKPVWTLLPFAPDWRWMLERSDSPWYPTMRLFRQRSSGDWDSVIRQVTEALTSFVQRP